MILVVEEVDASGVSIVTETSVAPPLAPRRGVLVLCVLRTFAMRTPVGILVAPGFSPACRP